MQLVRTTLRLDKRLKKEAQKIAFDEETTLQDIFNRAIDSFVEQRKKKAIKRKIKIPTIDLGYPLDNLTRDNFYEDPTKDYH